ncbi:ATP-dependent DNA helicase RecG [Rurimicrobium arvi]|uniref:ATP-dependent DNA helicase RecG n=1 Tax=Rurimicrobium arvi TaxID=2049916 RepID=A0ABP8MTM2_9BACT
MGPQRAELLKKELEIVTYEDLLNHFPFRYYDKTRITKVAEIRPDTEYVLLSGKIVNLFEEGQGRKRRLSATFYDETGSISLVWFQNLNWVTKNIEDYGQYVVFGKVTDFNGSYSITHPEVEPPSAAGTAPGMQPVYSSTARLTAMGISNRSFAKLTHALFSKITPQAIPEILPASILQEYQLMPRATAYHQIHFPADELQLQRARFRLKWEELFIMQMQIANLRLQHTVQPGFLFTKVGEYFNRFYNESLPFDLTGAQKRVLREIRTDTTTELQMNRLVQGDVGSGKTVVATMSMLLALDNGFQACLMAPTEILARQHYQSVSELLEPIGIKVAILTGTVKGKDRKAVLNGLADGSIQIVIGTHALIEDSVRFHNLGIAVVDEQHKFGVGQRARLWSKNTRAPHILVMTATPIPRTLAMTLYGDLEVSVIDELPPGRKPIKTIHRPDRYRAQVMGFLKEEIAKGRQVYIVYPLIEESEKIDYESLMAGYEQVKSWFPEHLYKIAMVHGRQDPEERKRNMDRFVKGQAHILVATTVIEVGVNVPNASVMLIESAERFGLSQLHQLRGRVGRGADQSFCILLTGSGISKESAERMQIMASSSDGFVIAEKDLEMRGPGDVYGTRQSGVLKLKVADIVKDVQIMEQCRNAASLIVRNDPKLLLPAHAALREALRAAAGQSHWNKIS